jgi:arsenite methyltransferase
MYFPTIMPTQDPDSIREQVRARYGAIAEQSAEGCGCAPKNCCCGGGDEDAYGKQLGYSAEELTAVPEGANLGLGCGNPLAIASLRPGETVVDLGSGAGFDCFVAARQLAGTGRIIGVDMTAEMVAKARRNALRAGYNNVEFRLGEIEALPVPDGTADLIISNCVINLSPDKPRVLREAFRVLKSGGRLSIADVIARQPLPAAWREDPEQLTRCISGAETAADLQRWLTDTGFTAIVITPREESRRIIDTWIEGKNLGDFIISAMIEARKP